jgi:hypothetical protein
MGIDRVVFVVTDESAGSVSIANRDHWLTFMRDN